MLVELRCWGDDEVDGWMDGDGERWRIRKRENGEE